MFLACCKGLGLLDDFMFPCSSTSAGRAAAELLKRSKTINARIGLKSIVPPRGGMIPLKRLRYGSQMVARGPTMACGGLGNQVKINLPIKAAL